MKRWTLRRVVTPMAVASLLLACATAVQAQGKGASKDSPPPSTPASGGSGGKEASADVQRKWAAQTSPTEIRLTWDEIPHAVMYRVSCVVGDAPARVLGTVSGNGRAARSALSFLSYMVRAAGSEVYRCFVDPLDAKGRAGPRIEFNPVRPVSKAAISPTVPAPASVTATESGPGEITLEWDEVPGATAYYIGRSVFPEGIRVICHLCPTGGRYTDRDVRSGAKHVYVVSTITPGGVSRRTTSNAVTPGGGDSGEAGEKDSARDLSPKAASQVRAASTVPGIVDLSWVGGLRAEAYRILRQIGSGPAIQVGTVTTSGINRFRDRVGVAGAVVRYAIVAMNPKGEALPVWSNEVQLAKSAATDTASTPPSPTARTCTLEYQRADNMWAALGRPDGGLGVETITVPAGETRLLHTDWKFEKRRNDGTNYYGSHLRIARNAGERPVQVGLSVQGGHATRTLQPGQESQFKHDLAEVTCR